MRYFYFVWIILFFNYTLIGQNNRFQSGEILLHNGTQKTGFIFGQFHLADPKGVYYKKNETDKSEYIEFEAIQEVRFGANERYISHCTSKTAQQHCYWLKTLLLGGVKLHQSVHDQNLYFMQEGVDFYGIRQPGFEGLVALLRQKCPNLAKPADLKFSTEALIQLIANYSTCKNAKEEVQSLYLPDSPVEWSVGLTAALNAGNASVYQFSYYGKGAYKGNLALSPGVSLQAKLAERWSAGIAFHYLKRTIKSDSTNVWDIISPNYSKIKISLSFIEIPVHGQYFFSTKKISPFVRASIHLGIPLRRTFEEEMFNATSTEYRLQPVVAFNGMGLGYGAGLGAQAAMGERAQLQVLAQYTRYATTFTAVSPVFELNNGYRSETALNLSQIQIGLSWLLRL